MAQGSAQLAVAALEQAGERTATAADDARWKQLAELPCSISVDVPVPGFSVKALLGLKAKSVIASHWLTTANLPLKVNGELIAWCEFEVLGNRVSVRLTELATER